MMKLSYDEAVAKIREGSSLSEAEIADRVNSKLQQFSGLVSKEGAAHIIANELGIKLLDNAGSFSKLKIDKIISGMQNVEVVAKVLSVYPVRQFNSNGREGQVGSALLGDDTGVIRSVFWNEQANKLAFMNKGDVVKLRGVYVKESRNNALELHFNSRSAIVMNPPGESVQVKEFVRDVARRRINEIADTDTFVEVLATVIEVFDLRFFEVCDRCGKRSKPQDSVFMCAEHGAVSSPNYSYLVNVFLDDGTASVRTVFFRNAAQKFLKKTDAELLAFRAAPEAFEQVKNEALGSFVRISARVNRNEMFNRLELVANDVSEAKPEEAQQEILSSAVVAEGKSDVETASVEETDMSEIAISEHDQNRRGGFDIETNNNGISGN